MNLKKYKSFSEINKDKFSKLVKSGFGRALVSNYFEYANPAYICIAEEGEEYLGAIVVESIPELKGVSYLDKIVVASEHQGKGLGKLLWKELNGNSNKLIWRAKKENPIIEFYEKQSSGKLDFPDITEFIIFFYGLNYTELSKATDYAVGKKPTLE